MLRIYPASLAALRLLLGLVGIGAIALNAASVVVRWEDNSDNEVGFKVERATGSGGFVQIGTTRRNTTAFQDYSLAPNTTYRYRVRAFNYAGDSAYSNVVQVNSPAHAFSEPPVIGKINNQSLDAGRDELVVELSIHDDRTSPDALEVVASSSNPQLVHHENVSVTGRGSDRKLVVRPFAGATGETRITVAVSDGERVAYRSFSVQVGGSGSSAAVSTARQRTLLDGRLVNLSSRAVTAGGAETLILGWNVADADVELLLRGVGPTLKQYGVTGAVPDPVLRLLSNGESIGLNDRWGGSFELAKAFSRAGAFALPSESLDAALLRLLSPGGYSAHLTGRTGGGVILAEIYNLRANELRSGRLTNISSRAAVKTGDGVLVIGFAVAGVKPIRVLLRAVGEGLRDHGVSGPLLGPRVEVRADLFTLEQAQGWTPSPQLIEAALSAGAFPLTYRSDTMLELLLTAGNYTAVVSSPDGSPGIALAELFELP
jgi:hypothetical protein